MTTVAQIKTPIPTTLGFPNFAFFIFIFNSPSFAHPLSSFLHRHSILSFSPSTLSTVPPSPRPQRPIIIRLLNSQNPGFTKNTTYETKPTKDYVRIYQRNIQNKPNQSLSCLSHRSFSEGGRTVEWANFRILSRCSGKRLLLIKGQGLICLWVSQSRP